MIRRIKHILSRKILMNLYYTMIYPFISYCNIVWASTYKTNLNNLLLMQKQFRRLGSNTDRYAHALPLFRNLEILNIYGVNKLQICLFVFKHKNNMLPDMFKHFFQFNSLVHAHNTRISNDLHPVFFFF